MASLNEQMDRLRQVLHDCGAVAVAVSGGVDSLTLATLAGRELAQAATMIHAVSPAVPPDATRRVLALAAAQGWRLRVIDAEEFQREEYLANPVNRCYFCKDSLYAAMRRIAAPGEQLVSGTNLDDLSDYRPGLEAAREAGARHPFVEAGVGKEGVRAIAAALGLGPVAELPASPCLASRVETGIPVDPRLLALIDEAERSVREMLQVATVRCRYRARGIVLELAAADLALLAPERQVHARALIERIFEGTPFASAVSIGSYRMGSAFLVRAHAQ